MWIPHPPPFYTGNYLTDIFSEYFDVSKLNFKLVLFSYLFNFVY